jgi:hypothetical protein
MNKALEDLQAGRDPFASSEPDERGAERCQTFARLSIWIPLVTGIIAGCAVKEFKGMQEGPLAHWAVLACGAVMLAAVLAGIMLAIVALCGISKYGSEGILWRSCRGLCLSGVFLFAGVTGYFHARHNAQVLKDLRATSRQVNEDVKKDIASGKDVTVAVEDAQLGIEKMKTALDSASATTSGTDALVMKGSSDHLARAQVLFKAYATTLKAIQEPNVLDMGGVSKREQLQGRKEVVQRFMTANDKLQDFFANREKIFRRDLQAAGVPPDAVERVITGYKKSAGQHDLLVVKIRQDDHNMGTAILGMLNILDASWGKWTYNVQRKKVDFDDAATLDQYLSFRDQIESAAREQKTLQAKAVNLPNG